MPYKPYSGKSSAPPENQNLTPYVQFGPPPKNARYQPIIDILALDFSAPSTRKLIKVVGIVGGMFLLATIAFTPHGMAQFFHQLGHSIGFALSPVGIRLVAFTLLAVAILIIGTLWLIHYNEFVALGLMVVGVILGCIAGSGFWLNLVSGDWAILLGGAAIGLLWAGHELGYWEPFKRHTPPPPPPARQPAPSPFPTARAATGLDIHTAINGSGRPDNGNGKKHKRRD